MTIKTGFYIAALGAAIYAMTGKPVHTKFLLAGIALVVVASLLPDTTAGA